jgi:hypothetical protein
MVREIFGGLLAAIVAYVVCLVQTVAPGVLIVGLALVGLTAFFVTLFGVIAIFVLVGAPPGLAAAAGVIGFGGGLIVASIVVIKLVRWGALHMPASAEAPPSEVTPADRSRVEVMTTVAALDRHLAPPDDVAARDPAAPNEPPGP